jgi:hypothetical protein
VQAPKEILAGVIVAAGGKTVTMSIPRRIILTLTHAKKVIFEAGIQEVPVDDGFGNPIATHPYLINCGARPYAPVAATPNPITAGTTQPGNATAGALGATPLST